MSTTTDAQGNLHSRDNGQFEPKSNSKPVGALAPVDWTPGTLHPTGDYDEVRTLEGGEQRFTKHGVVHRLDGPAQILPNGEQRWMLGGFFHSSSGPARISPDGTRTWYIHGRQVTEAQHQHWLDTGQEPASQYALPPRPEVAAHPDLQYVDAALAHLSAVRRNGGTKTQLRAARTEVGKAATGAVTTMLGRAVIAHLGGRSAAWSITVREHRDSDDVLEFIDIEHAAIGTTRLPVGGGDQDAIHFTEEDLRALRRAVECSRKADPYAWLEQPGGRTFRLESDHGL